MVRYIEKVAIDSYWPIVASMIEKALSEETSLDDIYNGLLDEKMGLLVVSDNGIKAACVCEFIDYPQINALRVIALGGDGMKEWLPDLIEFLDTWAIENNMNRIEQMGRNGWDRVLPEYGYEKRYIFMTKELSYG